MACATFALKKWTLRCNCDFVYRPTVLQLQQQSDLAKSGSGRILGVGYPNPVSGRKSISVHPFYISTFLSPDPFSRCIWVALFLCALVSTSACLPQVKNYSNNLCRRHHHTFLLLTCAGDYVRYAHGLIADYLPEDIGKQLATSLGFVTTSVCLCSVTDFQLQLYSQHSLQCDFQMAWWHNQ